MHNIWRDIWGRNHVNMALMYFSLTVLMALGLSSASLNSASESTARFDVSIEVLWLLEILFYAMAASISLYERTPIYRVMPIGRWSFALSSFLLIMLPPCAALYVPVLALEGPTIHNLHAAGFVLTLTCLVIGLAAYALQAKHPRAHYSGVGLFVLGALLGMLSLSPRQLATPDALTFPAVMLSTLAAVPLSLHCVYGWTTRPVRLNASMRVPTPWLWLERVFDRVGHPIARDYVRAALIGALGMASPATLHAMGLRNWLSQWEVEGDGEQFSVALMLIGLFAAMTPSYAVMFSMTTRLSEARVHRTLPIRLSTYAANQIALPACGMATGWIAFSVLANAANFEKDEIYLVQMLLLGGCFIAVALHVFLVHATPLALGALGLGMVLGSHFLQSMTTREVLVVVLLFGIPVFIAGLLALHWSLRGSALYRFKSTQQSLPW